jgi:hypothetical protein
MYLTRTPHIGIPVNGATQHAPHECWRHVVVLVCDGEAAGKRVDRLFGTRFNAGHHIIMLALGDSMLHGERQMGGV